MVGVPYDTDLKANKQDRVINRATDDGIRPANQDSEPTHAVERPRVTLCQA